MSARSFSVAVLAGDGIGAEITPPALALAERAAALEGDLALTWDHIEAGAAYYQKTGVSIPDGALDRCRAADAMLLAAMGLPSVRYPNGTEISPQLELREALNLFAGERPVRTMPGLKLPLADPRGSALDLVLIRESTEGLFAGRGHTVMDGDEAAHDRMTITRKTCERLFDHAFTLARARKAQGSEGRVTCIDKANVLGSLAFFRKIFDERAARFPDIIADHAYVDATALNLVRRPWAFDVLVTENMFGDILSDLGAALMGGMGMAPSADIGTDHALFQPCHGSAPDIMGERKANPTAMFLSVAMMFDWLGRKHGHDGAIRAGQRIVTATRAAYAGGDLVPYELGGSAGTDAITDAVMAALG